MDATSSLIPDFDDEKFLKLKVGVLKYDKSGVDKEVNESLERSVKF